MQTHPHTSTWDGDIIVSAHHMRLEQMQVCDRVGAMAYFCGPVTHIIESRNCAKASVLKIKWHFMNYNYCLKVKSCPVKSSATGGKNCTLGI